MKTLTVIAGFAALSGTPVFAADMAVKAPPPALAQFQANVSVKEDITWCEVTVKFNRFAL